MFTRLRRRRHRDDAGFSLIEVMVGATIMSIVMGIAAEGFLTMYRATNRSEAAAVAQTALNAALGKLDREVRYAYRVNNATSAAGRYAITFVAPDTNNKPLCVELSLPQTGGALLRTQWDPANTTAGSVVTGVANDLLPVNNVNPFKRIPAGTIFNGTSSNFDRLEMIVDSNVGLSEKQAKRRYELRFTALNTSDIQMPCNNKP
jgi:prepilin-type N-terminal cleavage/methylation domain-containing protein